MKRQAEGEALASIQKGNTGEAVRKYQRYTTLSLRESKLAVNALVLVHLSEGRVNAKVAHTLIPFISGGHRQEAVSQLMNTAGYEKAEAKTFIHAAEKAINRGGSGVSGPPWLAFGLGLLIFLLLVGIAFVALS